MRRENRTGCVYQAKENRRKPWGVKIPVKIIDKDGKIRIAQKFYGYFVTEKEAIAALSAYIEQNQSEINSVVTGKSFTFISVYEEWFDSIAQSLTDKKRREIQRYFQSCESIHDIEVYKLNTEIIESLVHSATNYDGEIRFKSFFNSFFVYAIENNYTAVNLAQSVVYSRKP